MALFAVTVVVLVVAYQALVAALQITALPRLELPVERDGGGHGPRTSASSWLALAALGLSFWPFSQRFVRSRLAFVIVALSVAGATFVAGRRAQAFGGEIIGLKATIGSWQNHDGLRFPGVELRDVRWLLVQGQQAIGAVALALALVALVVRLRVGKFQGELLASLRSILLLLLGAGLTFQLAVNDQGGCFPLSPLWSADTAPGWDGVWPLAAACWCACAALAVVYFRPVQAFTSSLGFVVPLVLGGFSLLDHGHLGHYIECQTHDVPEYPIAVASLDGLEGKMIVSLDEAPLADALDVQLTRTGGAFVRGHSVDLPGLLNTLATEVPQRRALFQQLQPHQPTHAGYLVLRVAADTPVEALQSVIDEAARLGFEGLAFDLGQPSEASWSWQYGIRIPGVRLYRFTVPFTPHCGERLQLGEGRTFGQWLGSDGGVLVNQQACMPLTARAETAP